MGVITKVRSLLLELEHALPKTQEVLVQVRPAPAIQAPKKEPKAHPLPTINLAEEKTLSEAEQKIAKAERDYFAFRASPATRERVIERMAHEVSLFMKNHGFAERDYLADVRDFLASYEGNPAAGAARTTAVGSLMWLFVLTRALDPKVIVESGVFKGASLFTFFSAARTAQLHAFDIDLSNLVFSHADIKFHEGDWSEAFPKALSPTDLVYFDDHINNCFRVRQAYDQGFRHVIFDDSPEIGELHKWRFPGVPTIQMVINDTMTPGEFVEWTWKDKRLRYTYREEDTYGVKSLVDKVVQLPSLSSLTGRPTGIQTYVRLKA